MQPDRQSTQLPPARLKRRRDWGRVVARGLCIVFAIVGILPIGLAVLVRSSWARTWATHETERMLAEKKIHASYQIQIHLWPLSVELGHVRVESSDGGAPVLVADKLSARPQLFALFAGKLAIEQIDIESPKIRLALRNGKITNLELPETDDKKGGPIHAPFGVFAMTDGSLDLDIDGVRVLASEVDSDVTVDDNPELGSSFEVGVRVGKASFQNVRTTYPDGPSKLGRTDVDDDALCMVDGRLRIEPKSLLVRRFTAVGAADLDRLEGTAPSCDLSKDDKRRVELSLSHVRVAFPEKEGTLPKIEGHVRARAPLGVIERLPGSPSTDGWVGVDADIRFTPDTPIPEITGHLEAHGLRVDHYSFASEIQSDLSSREGLIKSSLTTLRIADGLASLSEVSVDLGKPGYPIKVKVDVKDASFAALMRDLGVSKHPHVTWDLREVHVPIFHGTLVPLKLEGDMTAKTANFAVYDVAVDDPARARLTGFKDASLASHVLVSADALQFLQVRSVVGKSVLEGGFCSIGFHEDLRVDLPKGKIDLEDITPLAAIHLAGQSEVEVHMEGKFNDPHLEAEAKIENFILGDIPFGNVNSAHVSFSGQIVDLKSVKATKGKSGYELPTARLDFGAGAGMVLDGTVTSSALSLRDFFSVWKMEDDPRFLEVDGTVATNARVHVALGGPEDPCGEGFIDVGATVQMKSLSLFGEKFDDGSADFELKWKDRAAGIQGAELDLRSLALRKVGRAGRAAGSVLGSATIQRGGEVRGSLVLEAIPLSRIDSLGKFAPLVEGTVSGVVKVGGTVDAYAVEGDMDVTPVRIRRASYGSSQLHLKMTQNPPTQKPIGKTKCGAPTYPLFDKEAFVKNTSSQGDYIVSGTLLGGQVIAHEVTMTRQKAASITANVELKKVDLAALTRINAESDAPTDTTADVAKADPMAGELSGNLIIERMKLDDLTNASARFTPTSMVVSRGGQRVTLRPTQAVATVAKDALTFPPLVFDVNTANGLKGAFTLKGSVSKLTRDTEIAMTADLAPIDLGIMVGVVPKLSRAQGTLSGTVRLFGRAASPDLDGSLRVRGGEFAVIGAPGVISEVDVDVSADSNEIRMTRASAKFAGGEASGTARIPIKGLTLGLLEANIVAHDIHLAPTDGVRATLDCNLNVAMNLQAASSATARLPQVSGDVVLTSFEYTRPIGIDLVGGLKVGAASRTVIENYDPSLDTLHLDLTVRSRSPLKIRNNLLELQLAIEPSGLAVSGTNQRVGLKGELRALPAGRFRYLSNDFEIKQAVIRFDDPTRIAPKVDVLAVTEYKRYSSAGASTAAGASAGSVGAGSGTGQGAAWRISLHAYGDTNDLRVDLTSEPALSRDDIALLLTIGLTRAEIDQVRGSAVASSLAFEAVGALGADRAVKDAIPVIDDFRFGSAYSPRTGRTEPQVTVGKRLTDDVRASVSTGLSEDRQLRSNVEWRLNRRLSVQGSYDNLNTVTSSTVGNVGVDFRWRLEFE